MRSPGRRWSVEQQCVAIFISAFIATLGTVVLAMRTSAAASLFAGRPLASTAVIPQSKDDYLGYYRGAVEEYAVYDNLGHVSDALKNADVIFLGNSRVEFAFRDRAILDRFFAARSLKYYVAAFGYGEQSPFPQAIIRKYDLHPKWVIVNPDPFFGGTPSYVAKKVMAESDFDAFKFQLETVSAFESQRYLHRIVPYLGTLWWIHSNAEWIWFRSKRNGTIFLSAGRGDPAPAVAPSINAYGALWEPGRVPAAIEFKRDLAKRGAKLVLTRVPPDSDVSPIGFAKVLHVPLIAPDLTGLWTLDGHHLDDHSAARFDAAFLEEFGRLLDSPQDNQRLRNTGTSAVHP
jgi:hypothetical protein